MYWCSMYINSIEILRQQVADSDVILFTTLGTSEFANFLFNAIVRLQFQFCCCYCYPTFSEGWVDGGKPWSPRNRETQQGLDQRS